MDRHQQIEKFGRPPRKRKKEASSRTQHRTRSIGSPPDDQTTTWHAISKGSPNYVLIHTLGRIRPSTETGDGAYSNWVQHYFESARAHGGPIGTYWIKFTEEQYKKLNKRNNDQKTAKTPFFEPFVNEFKSILESIDIQQADQLILYWPLRHTGRPNGWTGLGITSALVNELRKESERNGLGFNLIYAIHEQKQNGKYKLEDNSAIVTLNPDIDEKMRRDFPNLRRYRSKVPGLMQAKHTTQIYRLNDAMERHFVTHAREPDEQIDGLGVARDIILSYAQRRQKEDTFKQLQNYIGNPNGRPAKHIAPLTARIARYLYPTVPAKKKNAVSKGIVIFGMISPRHGLNVKVIKKLEKRMNAARMSADLKIVIAGKESDSSLHRDLINAAKEKGRIVYARSIDSLDIVSGCRYAISFNPLGLRDNSSSMINLLHRGHLLFCKGRASKQLQLRSDKELIDHAVSVMQKCEANEEFYSRMVTEQQRLVRSTLPDKVGAELNAFFHRVAARGRERIKQLALAQAEKLAATWSQPDIDEDEMMQARHLYEATLGRI